MLRTLVPAAVLTGLGRLRGDFDWTTASVARCAVEQRLLVNESLVEVCETNVFEIFFINKIRLLSTALAVGGRRPKSQVNGAAVR